MFIEETDAIVSGEYGSFKMVNNAAKHLLSLLNARIAYNFSQKEIDGLIHAVFTLNKAQNEIAYRSKML